MVYRQKNEWPISPFYKIVKHVLSKDVIYYLNSGEIPQKLRRVKLNL